MDKYTNQVCPDSFSQKLDSINLLVNKCSHNLSSNLLTTSILSRDLMGLTTDIFDYDSRADQINNDSQKLKLFLDKLESLSLKMQFVESQIDALEQHQATMKKNKRHSLMSSNTSNSSILPNYNCAPNSISTNNRINHMRLSSVNSMKDQFLDLKTTEDTLQNVYQEFFHLKKIYLQIQSKEYSFEEDEEEEDHNNSNEFDIEFDKTNNLEQNTHNHQLSVSTAYTSLYDESQNLKPIKCTLKSRKRLSGLNPGTLYLNSGNNKFHYSNNSISSSSKSYNISQFSNDSYDNMQIDSKFTIINTKRKSYSETISEDPPKLRHSSVLNKTEVGTGVGIFQKKSLTSDANNLDDVNFGFEFPKNISFVDAKEQVSQNPEDSYKNQLNDADFKRQTMNWLSQFSMSKSNDSSDHNSEPISAVTPLSPLNNFHPSIDITKSSQALLLDMMCKVKEKERNLEKEIIQRKIEAAAENFLQLFSKNFNQNSVQSSATKNSPTNPKQPDDPEESINNNDCNNYGHDEAIINLDHNISDVASKYIYPISRVFSSFFENNGDSDTEPMPSKVDPILENGVINTEELSNALESKLITS